MIKISLVNCDVNRHNDKPQLFSYMIGVCVCVWGGGGEGGGGGRVGYL